MNRGKKKINDKLSINLIVFKKSIKLILNYFSPSLYVVKMINLYRYFLSPILPVSCRFYPSCSAYAITSFRKFGFWKGAFISLWRIFKCNPFHPGGFDPVSGDELLNVKSFGKNKQSNNINH